MFSSATAYHKHNFFPHYFWAPTLKGYSPSYPRLTTRALLTAAGGRSYPGGTRTHPTRSVQPYRHSSGLRSPPPRQHHGTPGHAHGRDSPARPQRRRSEDAADWAEGDPLRGARVLRWAALTTTREGLCVQNPPSRPLTAPLPPRSAQKRAFLRCNALDPCSKQLQGEGSS